MAVTREDVAYVAGLSRLRLAEGEAERLAGELSRVLDHVEALSELDVSELSGVGDMTEWAVPLGSRPAPDALTRGPDASAPDWQDGFFVVPRLAALDTSDPGDHA